VSTFDPSSEAVGDAIRRALAEDAIRSDVTSIALVPVATPGRAAIRAKEAGVVAGLEAARAVFEQVDAAIRFETELADGDSVGSGVVVARAAGPLRSLLAAERTALNFLQRMSGIATLTARYVTAVSGTGAAVLATRKTNPGLRTFDLAAVRAGGGGVHRGSLAAAVLVKENHVAAAGAAGVARGMAEVVALLVGPQGPQVPIAIEVRDLDELAQALDPRVAVVLLDNFSPALCARAVALRDARFAGGGGPQLEASGNVTLETIRSYAEAGVERISAGALTHSAPALDLSMLVEIDGGATR